MMYESMTREDRHNMLRLAEQEADELRNGDVRQQIDEWRKANPNAPTEDEYDYPSAARAGALPDPSNTEDSTLSPDYFKEDFKTKGTFNAATGTYDYPTEEPEEETFFSRLKAELHETPEDTAAIYQHKGEWQQRTAFMMLQKAGQGLFDIFWNEPMSVIKEYESKQILANGGELPEGFDMQQEWDNRPQIDIIRPIDMRDQIVSEIGAFVIPYMGAKKGLKPVQEMLKVNPTTFGKYLNFTVAGLKEIIAGMFADKSLAYGADLQENFASIMRDAMDTAYTEESGMASFGEFLAEIGIESEALAGMDASEAETDMERANMFAAEGAILGVLFPAVLRGLFGPIQVGKQFWRYAREGGFQSMPTGSPAAQVGKIGWETRTPNFRERMNKYTTPEERELLTLKGEEKIDELLSTASTPAEVAAMAAAGGAKRGWYAASVRALRHVFGEDAERFAALLAATSPQTQVTSNLRNTLNVWKNWTAAGRPTDEATILQIMGESVEGTKGEKSVLDAWRNNTMRALQGDGKLPVLSGPKVDSFMRNLSGIFNEVTNDTWMGRGLGMVQTRDFGGRNLKQSVDEIGKVGLKKANYIAANMLVREAAEIMSKQTGDVWTAAEIQETVWSWVKTIWDASNAKGETRTIPQLLREGAITDDMIRDTPDFATLFHQQGEFRQILEDAGYGQKLNDLPDTGFGTRGAVSGGTEQSGYLKSAAQRLDRTTRRAGKGNKKLRNVEQLHQLYESTFRSTGETDEVLSQRFRGRTRRSGANYLAGTPVRQYSLPVDLQKQFNAFGVSTPPLNEFADPDKFLTAINNAKEANPFGALVEAKTAADYAEMRTFLTSDGTAGFAIKSDGDIVSAFNSKAGKHKSVLKHLIALAKEQGGTKLDCYDFNGFLPDTYGEMGFKETKRMKWNDDYVPDDWDYEKLNHPDVVEMELR